LPCCAAANVPLQKGGTSSPRIMSPECYTVTPMRRPLARQHWHWALTLTPNPYSKRLLRTVQNDVWLNFRETRDISTSPNSTLPLIVKYNTVGTYSARIWRDILNENPLFNNLRIITAYSVHNNLGKLLCRNTTKKDSHQPFGCHRCVWPRCRACNYITVSKSFVSNNTHKSYFVRNQITCTTNNIVYLITCNLCGL
jgi:hypothetical protein